MLTEKAHINKIQIFQHFSHCAPKRYRAIIFGQDFCVKNSATYLTMAQFGELHER